MGGGGGVQGLYSTQRFGSGRFCWAKIKYGFPKSSTLVKPVKP